ncbi:MAG TPA: hypothetical protein VF101_01015 [Gaiellaceae bacterium]
MLRIAIGTLALMAFAAIAFAAVITGSLSGPMRVALAGFAALASVTAIAGFLFGFRRGWSLFRGAGAILGALAALYVLAEVVAR